MTLRNIPQSNSTDSGSSQTPSVEDGGILSTGQAQSPNTLYTAATSSTKGANQNPQQTTTSSSVSVSSTIASTPHSVETSSAGSVAMPESRSINAGAIAGSLMGGLAVGALVTLLFALLVIRRKYNSRLAVYKKQLQKDQIEQSADSYSDKDMAHTLVYAAEPAKDNQVKDLRKRIKALEVERNAASAFGDKLDSKSEQELLSAPGYGLRILNENVNQLAMTISVKVSGCGQLGTSIVPTERSEQISKLFSRGPSFVRDNFEDCLRHAINATLYERIALPFCFEASEQGRSTGYSKIAKEILRDNDQAMSARWRSMTHTTLRISADKKAKQSQYSASKQVQQTLRNMIIDIILYTGMEPNQTAACKAVDNVQSRISEVVCQCSKLMRIIREEMTSNDYAIESIPFDSGKMIKSVGLSAKAKTDAISRILLEPVAV